MGFAGIGELVRIFEDRFGKHPTNVLLLVIYVAIFALCLYVIWEFIVNPIYSLISPLFQKGIEITISTLFYVLAIIAFMVILYPIIYLFSAGRRVNKSVLTELSRLRTQGIAEILNGKVTSQAELDTWKQKDDSWTSSVMAVLRRHFPEYEAAGFETMGIIPAMNFAGAFSPDHNIRLLHFAKRLTKLEEIISRYS
jgi:hypothetical protein